MPVIAVSNLLHSNTEQWGSPRAKQNSCSALSALLCLCVAIQNIAQASSQVHPPLQQQTWIDTPSILTLQAHKHEQRANA